MMRNRTFAILVLFVCLVAFQVKASNPLSLAERLESYTAESVKKTVTQLQAQFKDSYALPADWEKTVDELANNRALLLQGLKANNPTSIRDAQTLIKRIDALLLANPLLQNKPVVTIRRTLGDLARTASGGGLGVAPSNFQNNSEINKPKERWTNELVTLTVNSKSTIDRKTIFKPKKGVIVSDPEAHWDGNRILFSSIGTNDRWHLFELNTLTGKTHQVTPEAYKDFDSFDGCYAPDGTIIFCSTGTFLGLPCTNGGNKMCGLFAFDPKTGTTRQLTFDQDSNWGPVVMNNGQVLYLRWEYADLPHSNSRFLFTMNPDGTSQRNYWGSGSYFPASFFGARPIPNHPSAFVGIATGHHSTSRSGRLMIVDPNKGLREADGVIQEIPYKGRVVDGIERDRLSDGVYPRFLTPYPLSSNYFLVTMKPTPSALWGLYLVDTNDNRTLLAEEEGVAFIEPILLSERKNPPIIPNVVKPEEKTATIFMQDIYFGDGLKGIPRGAVKRLRIGSYNFSPWSQGGLLGTIGMDGPWDVKRILGTVDVEEDGSAMFTVPANTAIFVQPLDAEGKALQVMRSWFTAMPGETQACVGCHETRNQIPIPKMNMASRKAPQSIREWNGKARGFSYRHEIQPILDRQCVACHDGSKEGRPYLKGDRWINDWTSQISGRADRSYGGHFTESYTQLHRYVRRTGIESDMRMLAPMDVHADQTELMQILNKGHYNVQLSPEEIEVFATWIDFNTPFHGRRSDIPCFELTRKSNDLREQYAPLFNITYDTTIEWLPEIPQQIVPLRPQPRTLDQGVDSIAGFPFYTHQPATKRNAAYNKQLALGHIRQRIEIAEGVTLELQRIPAGAFIMGSIRQPDEMPRTQVAIDKPYWIGRFEITNTQFKAFNPQHESRDEHRHGYQFGRKGYSMDAPDQPAVRLSWNEAMEFCSWLSKRTGKQFTLPTEAQWEWACRAGSETPFWFGDLGSDFSRFANFGDIRLRDFAACTSFKNYESTRIIESPNRYDDWIPRDTTFDDGGFVSEAVGRYIFNPWDVADMHGNVWEWTLSEYKPYPYADNDGRNSIQAAVGTKRVARGGSWYDRPEKGTSSYRLPYRDYQKVYNVGFRVVMLED